MLLILEVLLTVSAWRKGWGPIALLPSVIGFAIAFVIGLSTESFAAAFVVDLLIVGVLIAMIKVGRKKETILQVANTASQPEVTRQSAA